MGHQRNLMRTRWTDNQLPILSSRLNKRSNNKNKRSKKCYSINLMSLHSMPLLKNQNKRRKLKLFKRKLQSKRRTFIASRSHRLLNLRQQLNQISSRLSLPLSKLATTKKILIQPWTVSRRPNKKPRLLQIRRMRVGTENHHLKK